MRQRTLMKQARKQTSSDKPREQNTQEKKKNFFTLIAEQTAFLAKCCQEISKKKNNKIQSTSTVLDRPISTSILNGQKSLDSNPKHSSIEDQNHCDNSNFETISIENYENYVNSLDENSNRDMFKVWKRISNIKQNSETNNENIVNESLEIDWNYPNFNC